MDYDFRPRRHARRATRRSETPASLQGHPRSMRLRPAAVKLVHAGLTLPQGLLQQRLKIAVRALSTVVGEDTIALACDDTTIATHEANRREMLVDAS